MDLDSDVEVNVDAMRRFVKGMSQDGQQFVTMDDIADEEMMRREDEEEKAGMGRDSSEDDEEEEEETDDDVDAVVNAEEELLIAEARDVGLDDDDDGSDDDDSDDDSDGERQSPRTGFQARLERVRSHVRNKQPRDGKHRFIEDQDSSDDEDGAFERNFSWAEEEDDFIAHIEVCVVALFVDTCHQSDCLFKLVDNRRE
jgi:hypothetical protein